METLLFVYWIGVVVVLGFITQTTEPGEVPLLDCLGYMIGWPLWVAGAVVFVAFVLALAPFVVAYKGIRRVVPS